MVEGKREGALKALAALDRELAGRDFILGERYTIADISLYAYTHVARDADLPLDDFSNVIAWIGRVQQQPGFLDRVYPYSIDPHSTLELP